ncbi:tetraacyldisaccharide 4'-kinase [Maribrevibacterium harenarium]|uniref:Tetraacyldisaccharide 4'-kinase n=1 Tax=Maribrevibacterium harenarium TaxID=2589817 RepID=A0A501X4X7_9GAMM|nr:tetraacyldisaccharide 4'-kinase [Maribrevibacterium harenarium]TPE55493.1 tetraacyldisaccharide 4'-kinase [Maribrevibacterium harenarium]
MSWIERQISASWYRPFGCSWLLYPLLPLARWLIARKRQAFLRHPPAVLKVPVVVVGNITVGGTGKSPLVLALVELCQQQGWRVGIISRGYGSNVTQPVLVRHDSLASDVGDEPLMLAQRSGVPVCVHPQRRLAAEALLQHHSLDLILSDDGLQHYALPRDLEIAMIDGHRGVGNGQLLPVGPLREPVSRLQRVDFRFLIGARDTSVAGFPVTAVPLLPVVLRNVFNPKQTLPLSELQGKSWQILAGIGNPQRFLQTLQELGLTADSPKHLFPDHHVFATEDIPSDGKVVMTEKDAVKCRVLPTQNRELWYLEVKAQLPTAVTNALLETINSIIEMRKHEQSAT